MLDTAQKTTHPASAIPADDPSRKLSVIDPDDPALRHVAVVGDTYTIQSSTNLANPNAWTTLTNLTLTQSVQVFIDTNVNASSPSNPQTFYQALAVQ